MGQGAGWDMRVGGTRWQGAIGQWVRWDRGWDGAEWDKVAGWDRGKGARSQVGTGRGLTTDRVSRRRGSRRSCGSCCGFRCSRRSRSRHSRPASSQRTTSARPRCSYPCPTPRSSRLKPANHSHRLPSRPTRCAL